MDNDLFVWADLLLTAILEKRDPQAIVELAMRAGVDLDMLQCFVNTTLDGVRDYLTTAAGLIGWLSWPQVEDGEERLSPDDVSTLQDLGIDVN